MPKTRTSGQGRKFGSPNKLTTDVKTLILAALDRVGGLEYLAQQAVDNPVAFMSLLGKVLPLQLTGVNGGAIEVSYVVRAPNVVEGPTEWLRLYAPDQDQTEPPTIVQ